MDPEFTRAIWHDLKLNLKMAKVIRQKGLLGAKIKGMSNFKELYKIYIRHQKMIWDAGNEQATDTVVLPGSGGGYGMGPKQPQQQANILHFVASFNGADKIKSLADIGSMLALWAIEEACFWVLEDQEENRENHKNAQLGDLWIPATEIEDVPSSYAYDEASLIAKVNKLLGG